MAIQARLEWFLCYLSYWYILLGPLTWQLKRPIIWILPLAGLYAYATDFAEFKKYRVSFCSMAAPDNRSET
jgi:hypothetical protein